MQSTNAPGPRRALLATDSSLNALSVPIEQLQARIGQDLTAMPHLVGIRGFNHGNIENIAQQFPGAISEARILDIGASIHGFALDSADRLGFGEYIGIDLDINRHWRTNLLCVTSSERRHLLCQMDAHRLWFEDETMDVVVCLSGFEHYLYPEFVLAELLRVLKKGGVALINYEPIWTCSYGHHLHHFGIGYEQVPPWAHLIYNKSQMAQLLADKPWPERCPITKAQAIDWTYDGREINRRDCRFHRNVLSKIPCQQMRWLVTHPDTSEIAVAHADYAASLLPYSAEELLTRGFSCCFQK